jgi:hypothetical protein
MPASPWRFLSVRSSRRPRIALDRSSPSLHKYEVNDKAWPEKRQCPIKADYPCSTILWRITHFRTSTFCVVVYGWKYIIQF